MRLLIRVLLVFFIVTAVLSLVRGLLAPGTAARRRASTQPATGGRLVKDPVCGTYIPETSALRANENYFCSEECRQKFLAGTT